MIDFSSNKGRFLGKGKKLVFSKEIQYNGTEMKSRMEASGQALGASRGLFYPQSKRDFNRKRKALML